MREIILLKQGEMVLKGLNRRGFEDKLMGNAKRRLKKYGSFKVYTRQSATYIEPQDESCDFEGAWQAMGRLFGVAIGHGARVRWLGWPQCKRAWRGRRGMTGR